MNRVAALSYLTTEYQELATEANFTVQQIQDCYNLAMDMALRQLGYQETDLPTADVAQASIIGYLALLQYYALRRFERLFAIRVDVNVAGNLQAFRSQAAKQIAILMENARQECVALGFSIGVPAMTAGRFTLDFLEPTTGDF